MCGSDAEHQRVPSASRIQLAHHLVRLGAKRTMGVTVGGRGVPLVFLHGIGLNRRLYMRLISRLPQLGFLVIAVDAPGHGESFAPRRGEDTFDDRMAATEEVLDILGIERALLMGHSMGGRTAAELAARRPERALAAVLVDPAVGATFDASRSRIASPLSTGSALATAAIDTFIDRVGVRQFQYPRHFGTLTGTVVRTARHPLAFASAAAAIASAADSAGALRKLRTADVPVAVIHGQRDKVVPVKSAVEAAELSGGVLVTLPEAYHSWVLGTPWTLTDILNQLVMQKLLGEPLHAAVMAARSEAGGSTDHTCQSALVHDLAPAVRVLGPANPRSQRLYHDYRVWTQAEVQVLARQLAD
jgi:pimeloyl-ACP methyl ester carboxylesterase